MSPSLFQVLHISSQDMSSRIEDLANTSNNLSNVNTVGYKQTRMNFQELLTDATRSGCQVSSTQAITTQGKIRSTGILTDLSINGDGYFSMKLSNGQIGYTRDGALVLDSKNNLLTSSGNPLIWNGKIPTNASEVAISDNGVVSAKVNDEWVEAGTIKLTRFTNPGGLTSFGNNIWLESTNSGKAKIGNSGDTNFGVIVPGTLENANVNMSDEITHIIVIQRSFQLASQAFQNTGDMISQAIQLRKT